MGIPGRKGKPFAIDMRSVSKVTDLRTIAIKNVPELLGAERGGAMF